MSNGGHRRQLTSFGEKEALLEKIGYETKQGDEASKDCANHVEIGYRKSGHIEGRSRESRVPVRQRLYVS